MPVSAHATVNKAASYLEVEVVRTPLRSDLRADVRALEAAVDDRTFLILGSAPGYPHGVFDDIAALGEAAARHGTWLHVDACVWSSTCAPTPSRRFRRPARPAWRTPDSRSMT